MSEEEHNPFFKLLLVGPPGAGKSVGAASWIEEGINRGLSPYESIDVFDFDFRLESLRNFYPSCFKEGVNFRSYRSDDFPSFIRDFNSAAKDPKPTILVDSLTFMTDGLMQHLFSFRRGRKKNEDEDKQGNVRRLGDIDIPHFPEWMGEAMGMSRFLDIGKTLQCNFIMTAHVTKSLDIDGDSTGSVGRIAKKNVITIGSKVAQKIPGFFDEIYTCRAQQQINMDDPIKYFATTVPHGDDLGKTCRPLPHEIEFTHPRTLYREVKRLIANPEVQPTQIQFNINESENI